MLELLSFVVFHWPSTSNGPSYPTLLVRDRLSMELLSLMPIGPSQSNDLRTERSSTSQYIICSYFYAFIRFLVFCNPCGTLILAYESKPVSRLRAPLACGLLIRKSMCSYLLCTVRRNVAFAKFGGHHIRCVAPLESQKTWSRLGTLAHGRTI